jgi:hypothetical protein
MIVYDVIHGYQPFTKELVSDWVEPNLERIFIPTSSAMSAGLVRRNVQLQGWTIDEWLSAGGSVTSGAKTVLKNLRAAFQRGHIEVGFSAYSHAMLPSLGEELAYAQMRADYDTIREHIGEPTFFWFPECAVDATRLSILFDRFPGKIAVIPNGAIGAKHSTFTNISGLGAPILKAAGSSESSHYGRTSPLKPQLGTSSGRVAVSNTLVKDVIMNSIVYDKPDYVPERLDWKRGTKSMRNAEDFRYTLEILDGHGPHLIVRDWENGGSRDALRMDGKNADVAAMLDSDAEFRLISEADYSHSKSIKDVVPSCWEPMSCSDDPYPYWMPTKSGGWKCRAADYWLRLLSIYETGFRQAVATESGGTGLDAVDAALGNKKFLHLFKRTSPALLSCLPWHLMAREEWERFPDFPEKLLDNVVIPYTIELLEYADMKKEVESLGMASEGLRNAINSMETK